MEIKTKKQLNLPQLIEWAWKNNIENKEFRAKGSYSEVIFGDDGDFSLGQMGFVEEKDTFTVEVEEEIDEFSDIKRLAHYTVHGFTSTNFNKSIGELRKSNSLAFYIMNDDRTLTLIWTKEKGMVE